MKEEKVRITLSVALPDLNTDITKVVIPQVELFTGSGVLALKFHAGLRSFSSLRKKSD